MLKSVPDSRLIVLADPGSHRDAVRQLFEENGIAPARLEFVPRVSPEEQFKYYQRIDLCLDPVPYPGHTTTFDALWMGVPPVTLSGNTAASRGGASILSNLGLEEFIARSADEYVSIAARISAAPDRLGQLRQTLRAWLQESPLMDGKRFATDMEAVYRQIWRAWCASGDRPINLSGQPMSS